ncbi:MAG: GTP pyrophosphokinase [Paludibacter sp. 47-17]|nr:MAG: GTP pyrophosphokinase [Paludibacter sp. SCN 50-10]OJX91347.1 MAG: GTP pyrophosphokinase [Paludibacter sp. 47-17]
MEPDQKNVELTEDELIQQEFDALLNDYLNSPHRKKVELITKAFNFAKAAHKGIRRRSGEPYIMHPLAVARIVSSEIGMGSTSICSALLHDVVEDTDYTVEDIANLFGPKIAQIVEGLTKISGGVFAEHASAQAENFRKLVLTMSEDIRVILIKIADRLHNMRTLGSMPPAKQYKITGETQYIYAPLAHRLGLFRIKNELENLSFKYEHPETFARIEKQLADNEQERTRFYDEFTKPISNRLTEQGWKFWYKARVKTVYSIWKKMTTRNISFEEVFDIMALRIIFTPREGLTEKEQCWIVYSAITAIYKPHPDRIRDWVSNPKANGYEALHVTVMAPGGRWVEIQIRTERMNDIAEKGLAAHWKYKSGEGENESELDKWMKTIKELLENPEPNAIDFIDTFKLNLFASEIFVFTPKGEIKTIPQGSTALDFAYAIHSDLGEHCIGAKVNHKLVPLSHTLQSGDQVEILTSKKQQPQPEWIEYVTTARAKARLRVYFKREEKNLIADGQKKVEQALLDLQKKNDNETLLKVMKYFDFNNRNAFYLQVGLGKIKLDDLGQTVFKPKSVFTKYLRIPFVTPSGKTAPEQPEVVPSTRVDRKKTFVLREENAGVTYRLAPCCKPIPGDDVLGYVDENEIVIVHRRECAAAAKLKSNFGNNLVSAKWATHKTLTFNEVLEIRGIDKKGVLIQILHVISEQYGVNISKIHIETNAGIFVGQFYIYVHDKHEIETLAKNINKIKEVNSTQRILS